MLPVWLLNCDAPSELGVMQYCVPALMYIAMDSAIHPGKQNKYLLILLVFSDLKVGVVTALVTALIEQSSIVTK